MEQYWLKGKLSQLLFHNEENWYTVASFQVIAASDDACGEVTVVGEYPHPFAEEIYVFYGNWVNHSKYGRQFKAERFHKEYPKEKQALVRYLSSDLFSGIGRKTAEKIVEILGENALDLIVKNPACLEQIPGLSAKKREMLSESVRRHKNLEQALIFLYEFGIGPRLALRIYQHYKEEALDVISKNPYRLIEDIEGIGFLRADKIGQALGIAHDSEERIRCALFHCLYEAANNEGHTYLDTSFLLEKARHLLTRPDGNIDETRINDVLQKLGETSVLLIEDNRVYLPSLYYAECGFAGKVKKLAQMSDSLFQSVSLDLLERGVASIEQKLGIQYNELQRSAIYTAMQNAVTVLTGGPGTGKTTDRKSVV